MKVYPHFLKSYLRLRKNVAFSDMMFNEYREILKTAIFLSVEKIQGTERK